MNATDPEMRLSEAGEQRRREMLASLQQQMVGLHRRRRRRRRYVASGIAVLIAAAIVVGVRQGPEPESGPERQVAARPPQPPAAVVTFVETDSHILDRYIVRSTRPDRLAEALTDEQLVAELAEIDPTLGLVRIGSHARIWGAAQWSGGG